LEGCHVCPNSCPNFNYKLLQSAPKPPDGIEEMIAILEKAKAERDDGNAS